MSERKSIQINIPNPCHQNWDEMTPDGRGRHCAHCQKSVIDFTTWSDAALYNFFSKRNDAVCGRFFPTQINRTINIPYQPHSRLYRIAVVFGFTLLFSQPLHVIAQNYSAKIEQNPILQYKDTLNNHCGVLYGYITDEKKDSFAGVTIQLSQDGVIVAGTITDYDGKYEITNLKPGVYEMLTAYIGYDSISVKQLVITNNKKERYDIKMTRAKMALYGSTMIIREYKTPLIDIDNPTKRTFIQEEIKSMPY